MMIHHRLTFSACLTTFLAIVQLHAAPAANNNQIQNPSTERSTQPDAIMFTPPAGWRNADKDSLPERVKVMVVGKSASEFPPSISLGTEEYKGTLKQYLKRVKEINQSKGNEWKDLGNIRTEAGNASLSQVDKKSEWGDIRMMHVILIKNGTVYILTAASLKDDFANFYKEFFNSLRSLRFGNTPSNTAAYAQ